MRTYKIMVLGATGSGKTTFLASMFEKLSVQRNEIGFFLQTSPNQRKTLVKKFIEIADPTGPWPPGTSRRSEWNFECFVRSENKNYPIFQFTYLDYCGGWITEDFGDEELTYEIEEEAKKADALLVLLDGHKILYLMQKKSPQWVSSLREDLSHILPIVQKLESKPVHFVITKWDLLEDEYSLDGIRKNLLEDEKFDAIVRQRRTDTTPIRLIPISSVGKGFAELDQDGVMKKVGNKTPKPFQVEMPLVCFLTMQKQFAAELDSIKVAAIERVASYEHLILKLEEKQIEIKIIKGGGMLCEKINDLILQVINYTKSTLDINIEIVPSAEYEILDSNSIVLDDVQPEQQREVKFSVIPLKAKQIAISYNINRKLAKSPIYINAIRDNPYVYGDPVSEEQAFFGRKKELEQLIQSVTKPAKQDGLVIGERRTGKTSLLYQVEQRLESPFIPIYTVLNTTKPDTESVLHLILYKIINRLIEEGILEESWREYSFPYLDFIDNVREVINRAKVKVPDLKIVLLLDEADFLLKIKDSLSSINKIDERIQNILRAAFQSREIGSDLRAIVAGTNDLSNYISQQSSPFFNHFRFLRLKPLNDKETRGLIMKPAKTLGYSYTPDVVKRICLLSGRQPYYCQALCYESFGTAIQSNRTLIEYNDFSLAEKRIIEDLFSAYISGFWYRTNEEEKQILSKLTQRSLREKEVKRSHIKRLLDWNIIAQSQKEYSFASGLFEKWTLMALKL